MRGARRLSNANGFAPTTWRHFAAVFLATFAGGIAVCYLFVVLMDPYGALPLSLPIDRPIVSISQRYMYPQIVRSGRFDSLIVGTSTARLLDPERLNAPFKARFANLAMDSMTAWEQQAMVDFFVRRVGPPKVLVVAIDQVWCDPRANEARITPFGFPAWLYDENPWNEYLYMLNTQAVEIAGRLIGNRLGLYRTRIRFDGFGVFTPPEDAYDAERARQHIWQGRAPSIPPDLPVPPLEGASALPFPALQWLDETLRQLPPATKKVLAYMPVHVAAQPWPETHDAAVEDECKARIAAIGREHGAKVIDWRIASPITTVDTNYWDPLHYRLPIAHRLARELVEAAVYGRTSEDRSYRIVVR